MSISDVTVFSGNAEERFRQYYAEVQSYGRRTVEAAWHAGRALVEVKASLPHGEWLPWLDRQGVSKGAADRFMKLAQELQIPQLGEFASITDAVESAQKAKKAREAAEAEAERERRKTEAEEAEAEAREARERAEHDRLIAKAAEEERLAKEAEAERAGIEAREADEAEREQRERAAREAAEAAQDAQRQDREARKARERAEAEEAKAERRAESAATKAERAEAGAADKRRRAGQAAQEEGSREIAAFCKAVYGLTDRLAKYPDILATSKRPADIEQCRAALAHLAECAARVEKESRAAASPPNDALPPARSTVRAAAQKPAPTDNGALDIPLAFDRTPEGEAVRLYNEAADRCGLPKAQAITATRRSQIRQRLKDCGGIEGWKAALEKLEASPHCTGDNDRGWRADLTFLLQQKSFIRLMEGGYDGGRRQSPAEARRAANEAAAEGAARRLFGDRNDR